MWAAVAGAGLGGREVLVVALAGHVEGVDRGVDGVVGREFG